MALKPVTAIRSIPQIAAVILLAVMLSLTAEAQKVALVLSGGASRGSAHIGVLRALEENRVPIHYIIGTSIGAVIGGMYASGYTPDEIEILMASEEFQRWASGSLSDKYNFYYRKEDPNASWITTSIDFRKKLTASLPTQIINTQEIDLQILKIFAGAQAVSGGNFDSLLIPFRCMVTDIDSSRQMVCRKGDLSTSVRGSMSIPLVFNPVEIDNRLVFDGGIYNNFPCDVAGREFRPDVIIGSRVAQRYAKPDREDIVSQVLTMMMERQSDTLTYPGSVMIVPNIPPVNLLDFSKTGQLADSGYKAAMEKMPAILAVMGPALDTAVFFGKRRAFNTRKPAVRFDSIHITGLGKAQADYIRQSLKHGRPTITFTELCDEYFRFLDEGFVKIIYPRAVYNPRNGFFDLHLGITRSNSFSTQFGGNFSLANTSEAFLEVQYKYMWNNAFRFYANGYFGRIYSSAKVNARIDIDAKVPWFAEMSYTYNHYNYFRAANFFFDDKNPGYIIGKEYFGKIAGGVPVTNSGKISLSMNYSFTDYKYYQSNQFSRTDTADQTYFNFFSPALVFDLNSLNRKLYASAGARLLVRLGYYNGIEEMIPGSTAVNREVKTRQHSFFRLQVIYDNYFESLGPVKLGFYGEGVLSNQPLMSNYLSSMLYASSFQPVPEAQAYFLPPFRANNYAAAGLKAVLRIYKKIEYRMEGYLFQPYQEILANKADLSAEYGPRFSDRSLMASTVLVYNSPLGPLAITVNYFDKMPDPFTINFSIGYLIFNERAMP